MSDYSRMHRKSTSISSIVSDESTRELIESLGSESGRERGDHVSTKEDTNAQVTSNEANVVTETASINIEHKSQDHNVKGIETITPGTSPLINQDSHPVSTPPLPHQPIQAQNSGKKPIKFTVRKVSHESPDPTAYSNKPFGAGSGANSYSSSRKLSGSEVPANETISQVQKNVASSQEKYDQYSKKIEKINKEIDFLNKLLPPYNVEIDYATRTKITNAVEKLKMKQDELEKKKYSLGITISRLWRSMDDNDIWVRSMGKQ